MFASETLKVQSFVARSKGFFQASIAHRREFVMGALPHFFSNSFTAAGYPVDARYHQYSTARINANSFQSRFVTSRHASGVPIGSRSSTFNSRLMKPLLKVIVIFLSMIMLGGSSCSPLAGTSTRFSTKQIESYMQIVTSKLEHSPNQETDLGKFSQAKLACYSVLLGEGNHNGNHGLYTWFTCSGIHSLTLASTGQTNFSCTGFSLPVWIAPVGKSINYETISTASQYYALRSAAPQIVQSQLSSTYNLVHQRPSKPIIDSAIQGSQSKNIAANQLACS